MIIGEYQRFIESNNNFCMSLCVYALKDLEWEQTLLLICIRGICRS